MLVGFRYHNHANHSGYDRLGLHLREPLVWFGETPTDCYSHIVSSNSPIVHFLYGDAQFRPSNQRIVGKCIATYHVPPDRIENFGVTADHISKLDAIVIVGSSQHSYFTKLGAKAIFHIPHGVDTDFFHPPMMNEMRDSFRVLTVGKYLRDFKLFLRIAHTALERGLPLRFRLIYQGTFPIPFEALPANCVFTGKLSDEELRSEYQAAACLLLPLLDATANNALLEGLACGLPSIVSDVGSVRDYITDSAGILMQSQNENDWIEELICLATVNRNHRSKAQASRSAAVQYSWGRVASQFQSMYSELLSG